MQAWTAVVLAAGLGSRMKSRTPKVLHAVCGLPMVAYPLAIGRVAGKSPVTLVVPSEHQIIHSSLGNTVRYVVQESPQGTGHALLQTRPFLEDQKGHILVLYGDTPLLRLASIQKLMAHHVETNSNVTLLTAIEGPQDGMGRVVRNSSGGIAQIIEEHDASPKQRTISEVNGGASCFRASWLWPSLDKLKPSDNRGEIYLPDLVSLAANSDGQVEAVTVDDPWEVFGVNNRSQLAQAEAVLRERVRQHWMGEGVTLLDPASTFIDASVRLGKDTVVYPNTHLHGKTTIGEECQIGPNTVIKDSGIGERCRVLASFLEEVSLEPEADVGPFSHLRPGTYVERKTHIGNFVEVKNSRLGRATTVGHFSYIGDATLGPNVNIGAGSITCNFDGVDKHHTLVGEDAFIGCDTLLVAPVEIGNRAITGAGAVITHDVPDDTLVIGMPAVPQKRPSKRDPVS